MIQETFGILQDLRAKGVSILMVEQNARSALRISDFGIGLELGRTRFEAGAQEVLDRQTTHLARLVDDLLEVSRVTQGKIRLQKQPLDLAEVVRRTADDVRALFAERKVALELRDGGEALLVEADATRLAQVTYNLLQNAAKFTQAGGRATVTLERQGERAVLRVRDTGAGIDPATMARLFSPFAQGDGTLDRSLGGLGLGLAVSKSIVELHGGTIAARSDGEGKGAEFAVSLPLLRRDRAGPPAPSAAPPRVRRRVVLIEDNPDSALTLRDLLELEGHAVVVAPDGARGIEAALSAAPDVVLCDVGLPDLDGYEVARRLRAGGSRSRLVALTGYASPEDVERARAAGFDDHLAKPPDLGRLASILAGG